MAVTLPEAWQLCEAMDKHYDARFRARQQAAERPTPEEDDAD